MKRLLQRILKAKVTLIITDNTHVFLNAVCRKKVWNVRLHWMFQKASSKVWWHIARYILDHNKESSKVIDLYIENHWHWVRHPLPPITPKGKVYDLEKILRSLNRRYFKNKLKAQITWGKSPSRRSYEEMQLGSYSTSRNLITIHPSLDHKRIPKYVLEATVFHEMCHAVIPVKTVNGRKQIHPKAFKRLEAKYPHLSKARKWEENYF